MLRAKQLREWAGDAKPPEGLTISVATDADFRRVRSTLRMVCYAETLSRRLGPGSTREDMKFDKRTAHRLQNLYLPVWRAHWQFAGREDEHAPPEWLSKADRLKWGREANDLQRRAGAVVDWQPWCRQRVAELAARLAGLAALALEHDELEWGWNYCGLLMREIEALERIEKEHLEVQTDKRKVERDAGLHGLQA